MGDVTQIARRTLALGSVLLLDGRLVRGARHVAGGLAAGGDAPADRIIEMMWIDAQFGLIDILEGEPERALERLEARLQLAIKIGAGGSDHQPDPQGPGLVAQLHLMFSCWNRDRAQHVVGDVEGSRPAIDVGLPGRVIGLAKHEQAGAPVEVCRLIRSAL